METMNAMPLEKKQEEDSLQDVPVDGRDLAKEGERMAQNASDFFEESQVLVQELLEERRKPGNDDKVNEIMHGMALRIRLAEDQIALATNEEDKKKFQTTIELLKRYKSE
jgi:hypothetical protein